jgi:hypothetical protein
MQSTDRRHRLANPRTRAAFTIWCPSAPSSYAHRYLAHTSVYHQRRISVHTTLTSISQVGIIDLARRFWWLDPRRHGTAAADAGRLSFSGVHVITRGTKATGYRSEQFQSGPGIVTLRQSAILPRYPCDRLKSPIPAFTGSVWRSGGTWLLSFIFTYGRLTMP